MIGVLADDAFRTVDDAMAIASQREKPVGGFRYPLSVELALGAEHFRLEMFIAHRERFAAPRDLRISFRRPPASP